MGPSWPFFVMGGCNVPLTLSLAGLGESSSRVMTSEAPALDWEVGLHWEEAERAGLDFFLAGGELTS